MPCQPNNEQVKEHVQRKMNSKRQFMTDIKINDKVQRSTFSLSLSANVGVKTCDNSDVMGRGKKNKKKKT